MRLSVILLLVIVVMHQAADPAVYEVFFGPPPPEEASAEKPSGNQLGQANLTFAQSQQIPAKSIDPGDRRIANQLVKMIPVSHQAGLLRTLTQPLSESIDSASASQWRQNVSKLRSELDSMDGISNQQRLSWQLSLGSLSSPESELIAIDRRVQQALIAALDDAAAARVIDGSVWRSSDFDAFYRYLDQAPSLSVQGVAATGVLPLLQQPEVFRSQVVRTAGSIARADRIDAQDNVFGITGYWQLWIRPSDGADRPLVVITPELSERIQSRLNKSQSSMFNGDDGPVISVVGRFLKRLAYQSSIGADLAPVVVGRIVSAPLPQHEARTTVAPQTGGYRLLILTLLAGLFGFGLAALAMWRTGAAAKRSRQLRQSRGQTSIHFLGDLGDTIKTSPGSESDG